MFSWSSLLHLRIPFSYFLLPIFLFCLALSPNISPTPLLWSFIIIHFFLYPASNAYNSYFDKDEKSIGGLKNPPPVKKGLYYLALLFDALAIVLALLLINVPFAFMLLIYGLVSKAYSHPSIRLKKYAIGSWIITGLFQGLFTFIMCYIGINKFGFYNLGNPALWTGGVVTSLMLWANYPMTQIYQHEEDAKRGDETLSLKLGIKGTFYFTGVMFALATLGFVLFFARYFKPDYIFVFLLTLSPVIIFFLYWFIQVNRDLTKADYKHTMVLNLISSTCLSAFFIYLFLDWTQIAQAFN